MSDVTIWGAIIAGMLSFITPCVLPIVPFYLAYLAGSSVSELHSDDAPGSAARNRAMMNSAAFVLGLVSIFTIMGLSSSFLGQILQKNMAYFRALAGLLMMVLGLNFMGVIHVGFLAQERRIGEPKKVQGLGSAYLVGMAFAFGWTACVGPILAMILLMAAGQGNTLEGGLMLFAYGLGMGIPFFLAAVFYGFFLEFYGGFKKYLPVVEKVVGVLMIVFGLMLLTNFTSVIAQWLLDRFPIFMEIL